MSHVYLWVHLTTDQRYLRHNLNIPYMAHISNSEICALYFDNKRLHPWYTVNPC